MDKLRPPGALSFTGNIAKDWREWKEHFELYQRYGGQPAKKPWKSTSRSHGGDHKITSIITENFEAQCTPRKSDMGVSPLRNQEPDEMIELPI